MRSTPPKRFRLPETSSTSASGGSCATAGVNCAAQPAIPSSASVSSAGSRGRTTRSCASARGGDGDARPHAACPRFSVAGDDLVMLRDRLRLRRRKAAGKGVEREVRQVQRDPLHAALQYSRGQAARRRRRGV